MRDVYANNERDVRFAWLGKNEVVPGFEPGLLEGLIAIKIQSDNHYTTQPLSRRCHIKIVTLHYGILQFVDNHKPFFPSHSFCHRINVLQFLEASIVK